GKSSNSCWQLFLALLFIRDFVRLSFVQYLLHKQRGVDAPGVLLATFSLWDSRENILTESFVEKTATFFANEAVGKGVFLYG
ncbi:MAG: hypothetical protein ACK56R_14120, partial [Pirellulaceae bacterium]